MISERVPRKFVTDIIGPACEGKARIMDAFATVPRMLFVDEGMKAKAYEDKALPIGMGQTISQPSTVARMLALLSPEQKDTVLEIGSGSGFVTALLSRMVKNVYAVERIPALMEKARTCLRAMKITNAKFRSGDGAEGWEEFAPFDKIIVSAGATEIPAALKNQLADHGVMIIPVKGRLVRYCKTNGNVVEEKDMPVNFVDFVGS